ncbi:DUF2304 family protein [Candidatus Woesearchaeota archaeon]|nr:DUF2304 family protein [Candidatus Woesearchaeota archaeon]
MNIIQLFAILFSLFAASRVFLRTKDKKLTIPEFVFWMFIWGSLIITAFIPDVTSMIANFVGIGRGVDIIIYMSIGTVFYLIFRLYVKLEDVERELTVVIRELAFMKKRKK